MEVSLLLSHFKAHYFSPLGYKDYIDIISILGADYMSQDPKIAFDIFKSKMKMEADRGED